MIELVNGILWVVVAILFVASILFIWLKIEGWEDEKSYRWLITPILCIIFIAVLYYTSVKVNIIEAESTIKSFQDVKQRKEELGDNYILEPSILTDYSKAIQTLEKYKKLGFYNSDYTSKSIEVKIIDETGHNKYCGCSPCECIGGCKCTKDYPFPGYERTK